MVLLLFMLYTCCINSVHGYRSQGNARSCSCSCIERVREREGEEMHIVERLLRVVLRLVMDAADVRT